MSTPISETRVETESEPVLTAAQMRAAEAALIAGGSSVGDLMARAGRGAAEWVWRLSGGRSITVLCGPGNNGGDGWVIAETVRERGGQVAVVMAQDPATPAAMAAREHYGGTVIEAAAASGEVLVDCLFGTGLTRPLSDAHLALLQSLASRHEKLVAIDLPSGVDADRGLPLNPGLPDNDLTLALGAWKFAHFLMPCAGTMGAVRLVDIGIADVAAGARTIARPHFSPPGFQTHKYTRGLLGVIAGAMPGAAVLAARAAQGAGAGYVKLHGDEPLPVEADLVVSRERLGDALADRRLGALLVGPGLGRNEAAREKLELALSSKVAAVLDADALMLLAPPMLAGLGAPLIATPHEGELAALEPAFALSGEGSKGERATMLAKASGMVVVAKGADTVVAGPDGRLALAQRGSSWLSTAGTGDVLAGIIASRLASGTEAFDAACQGVWLHREAARLAPAPFTAGQLAQAVRSAYAACL